MRIVNQYYCYYYHYYYSINTISILLLLFLLSLLLFLLFLSSYMSWEKPEAPKEVPSDEPRIDLGLQADVKPSGSRELVAKDSQLEA